MKKEAQKEKEIDEQEAGAVSAGEVVTDESLDQVEVHLNKDMLSSKLYLNPSDPGNLPLVQLVQQLLRFVKAWCSFLSAIYKPYELAFYFNIKFMVTEEQGDKILWKCTNSGDSGTTSELHKGRHELGENRKAGRK